MADLLHSKWGASKFESLMACPGKIVLEAGLPNTTSKFAAEGTCAHQVLTWALQENRPAAAYIGRIIMADEFSFEVDDEMAEHVQVTIDYVLELAGDDGVVLVDQQVNYSSYLGVPKDDAWGTLDVAVLRDNVITAIDLKYGMGVEVSAGCDEHTTQEICGIETPFISYKPNPQVALYALGILDAVQGLLGDFDTVRLSISQPRITRTPSEYNISVADLEAWGKDVAARAVRKCEMAAMNPAFKPDGWAKAYLNPTEKGCKFCKAKAVWNEKGELIVCPALRDEVWNTTHNGNGPAEVGDFYDLTVADANHIGMCNGEWLATALSKCDLIEDWCKAVRAASERRLLAGAPLPGFKLVQGKRGARQWSDEDAAEKMLKSFRLKQEEMYSFKLISPTTAEKLAKAKTIGERQWPKIQALITQADGRPHVAPETDPRPALVVTPVLDDFEDVTAEELA